MQHLSWVYFYLSSNCLQMLFLVTGLQFVVRLNYCHSYEMAKWLFSVGCSPKGPPFPPLGLRLAHPVVRRRSWGSAQRTSGGRSMGEAQGVMTPGASVGWLPCGSESPWVLSRPEKKTPAAALWKETLCRTKSWRRRLRLQEDIKWLLGDQSVFTPAARLL